jgi:hypothetical protein
MYIAREHINVAHRKIQWQKHLATEDLTKKPRENGL